MATVGLAADTFLHRFLTGSGAALGDSSLLKDGSGTAKTFIFNGHSPPVSITSIIIYLRDDGTWKPELFGSATALSTGLTLDVLRSGSSVLDLDFGLGFKCNADFGRYTHDVTVTTYGSGDTTLIWELNFIKSYGVPLRLDSNEQLRITVNDDLSSNPSELKCSVRGYLNGSSYVDEYIPSLDLALTMVVASVVKGKFLAPPVLDLAITLVAPSLGYGMSPPRGDLVLSLDAPDVANTS